jgi:asparaginyl-tRNA synthetase
MAKKFLSITEAMKKASGKVNIRGWVYRERGSSKLKFIVLRDAETTIQCVIEKAKLGDEKFKIADKLQVETSMEVTGEIKEDKRAPTGYEISVTDFNIIGGSDKYPITKDQSPEFLLDKRHLWLRSKKMSTILRIRSTYTFAREEFFQNNNFYRFDPPILQPSQCEGGSTLFEVKYYKDVTYLSQSWQLYAEAAVFALERVYDTAPTFRAERSKTSRHLSEFWMVEAEAAWMDLHEITELAKEELKYCIKKVIEKHEEDLEFLGQDVEKLKKIVKKPWPTIKYREALKMLKEKNNLEVPFGKDLRTIEEETLMRNFDTPVVVTHYPRNVVAFYKPADPANEDEALCFDMLAPEGYCEIVGGSQRSLDVKDMEKRLKNEGEDPKNYEWYFDLRKYGSVPHSGYGVGLERVLAWICKLDNIKDAIAFPRTMLRKSP